MTTNKHAPDFFLANNELDILALTKPAHEEINTILVRFSHTVLFLDYFHTRVRFPKDTDWKLLLHGIHDHLEDHESEIFTQEEYGGVFDLKITKEEIKRELLKYKEQELRMIANINSLHYKQKV